MVILPDAAQERGFGPVSRLDLSVLGVESADAVHSCWAIVGARCSDPTILIHREEYDTGGIGADRSQAAGGPRGGRHSDVPVPVYPGIIEESGHKKERGVGGAMLEL